MRRRRRRCLQKSARVRTSLIPTSLSDPIPWTCNLESHHVSASRRRGVDAHKSDDLRACVSRISVHGE
jgi:hypothetical protein